ncbi:hypothetical protein MKEN_00948500 [Mycena kentingensis (nom. inval.)]|nr:hypothetical protein MKEN_00948500 [Mycena kentingensis (nom. inval.)]
MSESPSPSQQPIDFNPGFMDELDYDDDPSSFGESIEAPCRASSPAFSTDDEQDGGSIGQEDEDTDPEHDTDPEDEHTEDDPADVEDIAHDPLFMTRETTLESSSTDVDNEDLPPAFRDHPAIRHSYIRAFVNGAFHGVTHAASAINLEGNYKLFKGAEKLGLTYLGLNDFAMTIRTVEKRIGVSTECLIEYFFLCDGCWKPHTADELAALTSANCSEDDCDGTIYSVSRKRAVQPNGKEKRKPKLMLPYVSPERALQRACLQPGKVEQWQEWRRPADAPGQRSPSQLRGYDAFDDANAPLENIWDGWGWRAIQAGLERRRNRDGAIRDVDVHELDQQFVALENGLVVQINIDWFQAVKHANHSTGAMYAAVCNNPRGIRFLCEETWLLMMFPGPQEPSQRQFNNVLKIATTNFKKLYNGVDLKVHGSPERQRFNVALDHDVSDLPASRKTSGLLACTSKKFMCSGCKVSFNSLTISATYDPEKCEPRDPFHILKYGIIAVCRIVGTA